MVVRKRIPKDLSHTDIRQCLVLSTGPLRLTASQHFSCSQLYSATPRLSIAAALSASAHLPLISPTQHQLPNCPAFLSTKRLSYHSKCLACFSRNGVECLAENGVLQHVCQSLVSDSKSFLKPYKSCSQRIRPHDFATSIFRQVSPESLFSVVGVSVVIRGNFESRKEMASSSRQHDNLSKDYSKQQQPYSAPQQQHCNASSALYAEIKYGH